MNPGRAMRTFIRWTGRIASPPLLAAGAALASQGPGVSDGIAEPMARATAVAMIGRPPAAVASFALARLLGSRR